MNIFQIYEKDWSLMDLYDGNIKIENLPQMNFK